ncbi:MAG: GNAT family N-acetyltransferase [Candidatus Zixiibacteriota bacterium]
MATIIRNGLKSKNVHLRPTTSDDVELFFKWRESADPQSRELMIRPIKPIGYWQEEYKHTAANPEVFDLTLARNKDEGIIARVTVTDLNLLNRSCRLGLASDPELKKRAELDEGVSTLAGYLFRQYNLNSIYGAVTALDRTYIETLEALGFKRDGALRQRHFFDGEYHDVLVFSLLRYEAEV